MSTTRTSFAPSVHVALFARAVQLALAVVAVSTIASRLLPDCATYRTRPDVWALIAVTAAAAVALGWGAIGDSDAHRTVALAGAAAVLSILVTDALLVMPLMAVGLLRIPRTRPYLAVALVGGPLAVLVARGLPTLAQVGMSPLQFVCS